MKGQASYGFDVERGLRRVLRGRPSPDALDWVREVAGAQRVVGVRPLSGGLSSAVHLVRLAATSGAQSQVVLRRYVLDWVVDEPHAPANEATVLALLTDTPVPAPQLIAADPDGAVTGVPSLVMSALPGRVVWKPSDIDGWLRRLAEALPEIHAVAPAAGLRDFTPYAPAEGLVPPPWTTHSHAWQRARELYESPPPASGRVFLHRDYHPGNVLWSRDRVSGIVDWVSSCVGPPEVDVAHCRYNLAVHAGQPDAADRFLALWQTLSGRGDYDPYWDLTTIVSVVGPEPDAALDQFAARAAARLLS
jgi:aminoglycoside phosphotransferase (APT) family kinase protein